MYSTFRPGATRLTAVPAWGGNQRRGGIGFVPSYATAVANMVRVKDIFMPIEKNASRYEALNKGIFRFYLYGYDFEKVVSVPW
jgi:hypothetical protein